MICFTIMNCIKYKPIFLKKREDVEVTVITNQYLEIFFLDCSATKILNLLCEGYSVNSIVDDIANEYKKVKFSCIQEDVSQLIHFLLKNHIVKQC